MKTIYFCCVTVVRKNRRHRMRLAAKATSAFGSCSRSSRRHRHRARTSHWRSCHRDEAVVWGNAVVTWASQYPGAAKNTNLFMMSGYSQGRYLMYLMGKTTPSSDVVGDGGERHAISQDFSRHREGGTGDVRRAHGRVWPGTKERCSRCRSSPSGGPTKYKH